MQHDFYYRRESNRHHPKDVPAVCLTLDLADETTLPEALCAALAAGMSKGTHRSGCFEVQTDRGIWSQRDGNRIDLSTTRKVALTTFKTWEQLEAEEAMETAA